MSTSLPRKLVAIADALGAANIPHAFGGAIALAFHTLEPRGTRDLDLNIFVPQEQSGAALKALPPEVVVSASSVESISRDGQARLWWGDTPVDVFFDNLPIHEHAARNARLVPFLDHTISVIGPVELTIFKAAFNRTKDWADIEAMVAAESLDVEAVRELLSDLLGTVDARLSRFDEAVSAGLAARDVDGA